MLCVGWVVGVGVGVGSAGAQAAPRPVPCRGQRVDAIRIVSEAPSVAGVRKLPVLADIAHAAHVTTQADVVEGFLLLHVGDACSERRRAESERVLRAQPFLADASIAVVASPDGGVELEVRTIDEVALQFSATMNSSGPLLTTLRLGDGNLNGEGVAATGAWWSEEGFRDGYAFDVTNYQLLGQPYQAMVSAARDPLGGRYHLGIQRPFLTDVQRVAWRVQQGESDDYVRFVDDTGAVHAARLGRTYADIGGLARIGAPGRLALVGLSVSHEAERLGAAPLLITPTGSAPDPTTAFAGRYVAHAASRVNLLLGYRNLKFVRDTGFDALRNTQDIPVGIQVGTLVGQSASFLGSRDHDMLIGADVYAGAATARSALRFETLGEVRRTLDSAAWDGLLASGRLADFQKVGPRQMLMTSLEWAGGWRVQVPFRLTLAGTDGGVRGMAEGTEQGGRRAVLRVEDRFDLGSPFGPTAEFGVSVFADAGRLWAGDVPFGMTTPVRTSVGVSLLAAVPAASGQLWRLDLALPNVPGQGVRLALRISHEDGTIMFWREPRDVTIARERSVPQSLFSWP